MPGVRPLLDALAARDDVYLALLTGNYEDAARAKLEYFDLWRYFPCGAFGDDAPDRNGLLPKALATIRACGGPVKSRRLDVVVIGDTPLDVECAAAARAIARGRDGRLRRRRVARRGRRRGVRGPQRHASRCCAPCSRFAAETTDPFLGGSASESNRASPREQGATGFEDREGHRAPFASEEIVDWRRAEVQIDCRLQIPELQSGNLQSGRMASFRSGGRRRRAVLSGNLPGVNSTRWPSRSSSNTAPRTELRWKKCSMPPSSRMNPNPLSMRSRAIVPVGIPEALRSEPPGISQGNSAGYGRLREKPSDAVQPSRSSPSRAGKSRPV